MTSGLMRRAAPFEVNRGFLNHFPRVRHRASVRNGSIAAGTGGKRRHSKSGQMSTISEYGQPQE